MFCSVLMKENMNSSLNKVQQDLEENIKKGDMLPIIITQNTHTRSFVKGYHVYKHCLTPVLGQHLITKMEPSNPVDKYVVSVNKDDLIVGHLPLRKNGKFSMVIYLLRADRYARCEAVITEKAMNLGDVDVMQIPCTLNITGKKALFEILKQGICKHRLK